MKLTAEEVQKIARLARLKLSDEEVTQYQDQLSEVLTYIRQLDEVKADGATRMTADANVLADDEVKNQPRTKELLANAPQTDGDSIKVKAVFDE